MAGWFDGLFQGAAEIENRFARKDGARERPTAGGNPDYVAGFRQGVEDARAVASFRRAESLRRAARGGASRFSMRDPRT
jgi:hypothetical protein